MNKALKFLVISLFVISFAVLSSEGTEIAFSLIAPLSENIPTLPFVN